MSKLNGWGQLEYFRLGLRECLVLRALEGLRRRENVFTDASLPYPENWMVQRIGNHKHGLWNVMNNVHLWLVNNPPPECPQIDLRQTV